jgi:hypothetical protein
MQSAVSTGIMNNSLGPELVADPGFDTGTGWTVGANASITGSQLVMATATDYGPGGANNDVAIASISLGDVLHVELDIAARPRPFYYHLNDIGFFYPRADGVTLTYPSATSGVVSSDHPITQRAGSGTWELSFRPEGGTGSPILNSASVKKIGAPLVLSPRTTLVVQDAVSASQADNITLTYHGAGVTLVMQNMNSASREMSNNPAALGPDLFNGDGAFNAATNWTAGTGWVISGGVATGTAANGNFDYNLNIGAVGFDYQLDLDMTRTAGNVNAQYGASGSGALASTGHQQATLTPNLGTSFTFLSTGFSGTLDNITLKEKGALVLTIKFALAVAAATSLTQADNVILTPRYALSVAAAVSLSQASNIVFTSVGLAPAAATSLTQAGAVTLSPKTPLTVANATSLTQTTAPAPVFHQPIIVATANSASQAGVVTLTPKYTLTINPAVSLSQADNILLHPVGIPLVLANANSASQAGVFVTGNPEIFVNGDFSAGTANLTPMNGAVLSVTGGILRVTCTAPYGTAQQAIPTIPGHVYRVTMVGVGGTAGGAIIDAGSGSNSADLGQVFMGTGAASLIFTAVGTTSYILAQVNGDTPQYWEFSSISVKDVSAPLALTPRYGLIVRNAYMGTQASPNGFVQPELMPDPNFDFNIAGWTNLGGGLAWDPTCGMLITNTTGSSSGSADFTHPTATIAAGEVIRVQAKITVSERGRLGVAGYGFPINAVAPGVYTCDLEIGFLPAQNGGNPYPVEIFIAAGDTGTWSSAGATVLVDYVRVRKVKDIPLANIRYGLTVANAVSVTFTTTPTLALHTLSEVPILSPTYTYDLTPPVVIIQGRFMH